mgnify:CR=1 FL=1
MKKTKGGIKMLHVIKDDFDESPEDILNSINNMLKKKEENKEKNNKEDNKE